MKNTRNWFYRFMYGRYGSDQLNKFLLWVYIAFLIAQMVLMLFADSSTVARIIYYAVSTLALSLIVLIFYRTFSRDIVKRRKENERLLNYLSLRNAKKRDRKTHVYRKCPKCRAVLRLPKAKGKHPVVCPRCRERFTVRG